MLEAPGRLIESNEAPIGRIGLGYAGLPLCENMHSGGFSVLGFDVDEAKTYCPNVGSLIWASQRVPVRCTPATGRCPKRSTESSPTASVTTCLPIRGRCGEPAKRRDSENQVHLVGLSNVDRARERAKARTYGCDVGRSGFVTRIAEVTMASQPPRGRAQRTTSENELAGR